MKKKVIFVIIVIILIISIFIIFKNIPTKNTQKEVLTEQKNEEPAIISPITKNITQVEDLTNKPNLATWYFADVFEGLGKTSKEINFSDNYTYVYNDDGSFFSRKGPIFPVDPFYEVIYNDIGFEIRFSHFRTYNLGSGASGFEKYNDYVDRVERKDILDKNMTCAKLDECRGIKLIKCSKNSQEAYIWYIDTYLFSAYDNGKMLEIFKKFYC